MPFRAASLTSFASLVSLTSVALVGLALVSAGCSSSSEAAPAPAPADVPDAAVTAADAGGPAPDAGSPDAATSLCAAPPKKSTCGDSAWVRGVAHFDPSHFAAGAKPILRVALRHEFALIRGEETIGGRLHGYLSVPITDVSKGEIAFAIDMCDFGTSMWSEENGMFHLVLILDENGDNDLDKATSNDTAIVIGTPTPGELTSMTEVDVSCKAPSACVDVKVECTGTSCLTFTPIKSCSKKLPGCNSDSAFCQ
jgi:hypothetical protein